MPFHAFTNSGQIILVQDLVAFKVQAPSRPCS